MSHRIRAALAALALTGGLLLAGAGPAAAADPNGTGCTTPSQVQPTSGTVVGGGCQMYPDGSYLPVLRWSGTATSLHYKADGGITHIVSDMALWLQRDGAWPQWMTVGNTAWSVAASVLSFGVRAQPLQAAGYQVDQAVGQIGSALTASGVVALFVGVGLVTIAWRAWRQRRIPWAQVGRIIIVVGLLVAMTFGAQNSTKDGNGNYVAGVMSPGWIVNLGNTTVETIASAPAAALEARDWTSDLSGYSPAAPDDAASCYQYEQALYREYSSGAYGDGVLMSAVNVDLSKMWEQTGLQVWKTAQFGAGNPYGDYVYCHLLDSRAQVSAADQIALVAAAGGAYPSANPNSGAWTTGDDNESLDRSLIAWAACRPSNGGWTVAGDFASVDRSRGPITADTCKKWWTDNFFTGANYKAQAQQYLAAHPDGFHVGGSICAPGVSNEQNCWTTKDLGWSVDKTAEALAWGGVCEYSANRTDGSAADCHYVADDGTITQAGSPICTASQAAGSCLDQAAGAVGGVLADDGSPLYWGGSSTNTMNETANAPLTRNFLLALHGETNIGGTLATTIVYAIASIIVSVTFTLLGFGIFIAKLWPLFISIGLFFTFLRDVIFLNDQSASLKLLKQDLGVTFFAFGVRLVMSLVTLLTGVLVAMGSKWFQPGATESMVWLGLSPAVSVIGMHFLFTKVLKLPSPFSVKGVKTWGAAAAGGAVGGAVGSGLARMAMSPVRRAQYAMSRNLSDAAMYRIGLGALSGRRRRAGSFTAGAAAGAGAGAAAGAVTGSLAGRRPGRRGAMPPTPPPGPGAPGVPSSALPGGSPSGRGRPSAADRRAERQVALEAQLDGAQLGAEAQARSTQAAALKAARDARRKEDLDRRGYNGGAAGDLREAVAARTAQRLEEVRQRFAAKPVRSTLGLATKTAVGAGLVVGTGGLALPFMVAGSLHREVPRAAAARRQAVVDYRTRQAAAQAAAELAEQQRQSRAERESGHERAPQVQGGLPLRTNTAPRRTSTQSRTGV